MVIQRVKMLVAIAITCIAFVAAGYGRKAEAAANAAASASEKPADLIIHGGPILTMEGGKPDYVEAVVVAQGEIVFTGSDAEAMSRKSASTVIKDLGGKTMLPSFVDAHSGIEVHAHHWGGGGEVPINTVRSVEEDE